MEWHEAAACQPDPPDFSRRPPGYERLHQGWRREEPADMYEYIYSRAEAFQDQDLRNICIRELTDNKEKLMYYPAAQKTITQRWEGCCIT